MWKVYQLLKPALENRESEEVLLDEMEKLLKLSKPGTLFECLSIMYDNISTDISGMDFIIYLANGLTKNKFYEFVDFIEAMK